MVRGIVFFSPHLFIVYHFAGNVEAYVLFSHWADSRAQEDPDIAVYVEEWLYLYQTITPWLEGQGSLIMVDGIDPNMCNKTCANLFLSINAVH